MLTVEGKNIMLANSGGFGGAFLSAHTGFPGESGLNEVTSGAGGYARIAATFATPANGSRNLSTPAVLAVPAATIKFVGRWTALTAGIFLGYGPLGGQNKRFYVDPATDIFYLPAHGWLLNQKIVFIGGVPVAAGLAEGQTVFVRDVTTDTFKIALTSGGAAVDITGQPASLATFVSQITEEAFGAPANLTVNSFIQGFNG